MTTGRSWAERGVSVGRAQQPVDAPTGRSRDLYDEEAERFYMPIVERGDRVLRAGGERHLGSVAGGERILRPFDAR